MENDNNPNANVFSGVIPGYNDDNYKSHPKKIDERIKNIQDKFPQDSLNQKAKAPPNSR